MNRHSASSIIVFVLLAVVCSAAPLVKEFLMNDKTTLAIFNKTLVELFPQLSRPVGASSTGGLYSYSQTSGHFTGPSFKGGTISTYGCSGALGPCRNNPACQCRVDVGPLPQGTYWIGNMITFKGMPYCYPLTQTGGNSCGRSGFLIHGGDCSPPWNPSEGCLVIPSDSTRYLIEHDSTLHVTA